MKTHPHPGRFRGLITRIGATLILGGSADAGSRHFTYSYETTTMPKGSMELESWLTWKTDHGSDPDFERFDFRHEFEFGVTDRLQLALYFADWRHEKFAGKSGKTTFQDIAVEGIYNLTDPNTTSFGSALYGEIKGSDDFIELEARFLLQKNLGSWKFVYNIGGEIAWENDYAEDEAELMQSAGASYQINPSWSVGAELLHEMAVPDVDTLGDSGVFLGPNVAWRMGRFSVALTGLWQLTTLSDEPDFQLRSLFSVEF
jgi:hypothetical protein